MYRIVGSLLIAFVASILMLPTFIRIQKRYQIGQRIRQEGPDLHQHKTGTPTMGGLVIFFSIGLALIVFQPDDSDVYAAFILLCSFGFVGFLDDFIKYYRERSLGLKARGKVMIQLTICILFIFWMFKEPVRSSILFVPFMKESFFIPPMVSIPFIILVFISATNAVNLTDGLDGLATGLMMIALVAFSVIAFSQGKKELGIFSLIVLSSCAGFLVFNFYPARIFLGDVGSLGLGGVLAAIAVFTGTELFLLLIGGVFVIETLSVIIQVASIQMNQKPVFKMSPLHHHFELLKWKETLIVALFWGIGLILSLLGLASYPFG